VSGGLSYKQRTLVLGQTRSGKSELANHLFSVIRCQRVLIDTKGGEWEVDGVEPVRSPEAIDWTAPVIHYVSQSDDPAELDPIFAALLRRQQATVCVHELGDLCGFNPQRTPPNISRYISQGGAMGLGLIGASQRPVEMPVRGRTEAQQVFVMVPRLGGDDLRAIASLGLSMEAKELGQLLDRVMAEHGRHSFVWFTRGEGYTICPPLPEDVRARSIVRLSQRLASTGQRT
jgi:hypothetical protein